MPEGFSRRRVAAGAVEIAASVGGAGPPLLLLHGYPETHLMWHRVAPALAERFTVVATDLRGYGDSGKPPGDPDHAAYSKRTMAADQVAVMEALGFGRFGVAGHDRGGRVAHRMALDHPERVSRLAVLDIVPTAHVFAHADQAMATSYYHWFFLIQPDGLPERMIGADPGWYLRETIRRWAAPGFAFDPAVVDEYVRCFSAPDAVHGACEDYRAAASIDLEHDAADRARRVEAPLLVLWGAEGRIHRLYDVPGTWADRAREVRARIVPGGHFCAEEAPRETAAALLAFFAEG